MVRDFSGPGHEAMSVFPSEDYPPFLKFVFEKKKKVYMFLKAKSKSRESIQQLWFPCYA